MIIDRYPIPPSDKNLIEIKLVKELEQTMLKMKFEDSIASGPGLTGIKGFSDGQGGSIILNRNNTVAYQPAGSRRSYTGTWQASDFEMLPNNNILCKKLSINIPEGKYEPPHSPSVSTFRQVDSAVVGGASNNLQLKQGASILHNFGPETSSVEVQSMFNNEVRGKTYDDGLGKLKTLLTLNPDQQTFTLIDSKEGEFTGTYTTSNFKLGDSFHMSDTKSLQCRVAFQFDKPGSQELNDWLKSMSNMQIELDENGKPGAPLDILLHTSEGDRLALYEPVV